MMSLGKIYISSILVTAFVEF